MEFHEFAFHFNTASPSLLLNPMIHKAVVHRCSRFGCSRAVRSQTIALTIGAHQRLMNAPYQFVGNATTASRCRKPVRPERPVIAPISHCLHLLGSCMSVAISPEVQPHRTPKSEKVYVKFIFGPNLKHLLLLRGARASINRPRATTLHER